MQDKELFEGTSGLNGKSGATIGDALTSAVEVIKSLGIEILKSEKGTGVKLTSFYRFLFS
jgi:hypothetical protein